MGRSKKILSQEEIEEARDYLHENIEKLNLEESRGETHSLNAIYSNLFLKVVNKESFEYGAKKIEKCFISKTKEMLKAPEKDVFSLYWDELSFFEGKILNNQNMENNTKMALLKNAHDNLTGNKFQSTTVAAIENKEHQRIFEERILGLTISLLERGESRETQENKAGDIPEGVLDHIMSSSFYCRLLKTILLRYSKPKKISKYRKQIDNIPITKTAHYFNIARSYLILCKKFKVTQKYVFDHGEKSKDLPIIDTRVMQVIEREFNLNPKQSEHILRTFFDPDFQK